MVFLEAGLVILLVMWSPRMFRLDTILGLSQKVMFPVGDVCGDGGVTVNFTLGPRILRLWLGGAFLQCVVELGRKGEL